jgi:hypothetical protein
MNKPIVDWVGPSWEVARKFVETHPGYLLKIARLSGSPLLYRRMSGANLSKGLTGKYDSTGRKIGSLDSIEVFVNWNDVNY